MPQRSGVKPDCAEPLADEAINGMITVTQASAGNPTIRVAVRLVLPSPLLALVKVMVAL